MAVSKRPIGEIQHHVLWCMIARDRPGVWTRWSGWRYENQSRTERIMESLRLRGLVTALERYTTVNGRKITYMQYTITDAGRKEARQSRIPPAREN